MALVSTDDGEDCLLSVIVDWLQSQMFPGQGFLGFRSRLEDLVVEFSRL